MWRRMIGGLAVVALCFAFLSPAPALAACETVTVLGTDEPKNTGISITLYDTISVTATGSTNFGSGGPFAGADGDGFTYGDTQLPSAPGLALIGKVGTGGNWFLLGASGSVTALEAGTLYLEVNDAPGAFFNNEGSLSVEVCTEPGTAPGMTRPLASAEAHADWDMFDFDYINSLSSNYDVGYEVQAFSETFGANVAAVASGTVISITPFTPENCTSIGFMSLFLCYVPVPAPITGNSFNQIYALEMVNNWTVTVEDATDANILYTYILNSPTVAVGDELVAGCVIGQTIQIKKMPFDAAAISAEAVGIGVSGGIGFSSLDTDAGVTFVSMYDTGEQVSLYPLLTAEPNLADCAEQQLSACVNNNPQLTSFAYWERASDVSLISGTGGASLPPFTYITQADIMIDPDADYILSVQARKRETGDDVDFATMNLQIGGLVESFELTSSFLNYTLTTTGEAWHDANLTSIFISNQPSSAAPLEIRYACLAPVTASVAPGSCYFANHEFDADASGWNVDNTTFSTGQAFMRDGDSIWQTVRLLPDGVVTPHTYTVRAVARLLATGDYTGQIGKSATLNYIYPTLASPVEVGTIDSTLVATLGTNPVSGDVMLDYPYTLETTLEIEEDTSSSFTFIVEITDGDNYIQGLRIDSVCIDPEGDGSFPGQDDSGGYVPPMIEGCSVVPLPLDGSVAAWTYYHWSQLKRFFNCDLMKLLNKWFSLFDSLQRTIRNVARWWIALTHKGSTWLTSFIWWLNGSFRNIAMGQVTTVIDGGGCHDIFCAITDVVTTLANFLQPIVEALNNVVNVLVGVFTGVVNLFFTLIGGLVSFVVALLIRLFSFFNTALSLLAGLIGAYNSATPTAIPGLPNCALDPTSNPLCWFVWVSDNTFFQGRWNVLYVIILSILSIHFIIWAIREIRETILKTWGSS